MKNLMLTLAIFMPHLVHAGGVIISGGLDDRAVKVSFLSPGNGIDEAAKAKLLDVVKEGLDRGTIAVVTADPEGFEGDITYCLEFTNSTVMSQNFASLETIATTGKGVTALTAPSCAKID